MNRAKQAVKLVAEHMDSGTPRDIAVGRVARDMGVTTESVARYLRLARWADHEKPVVIQPKYTISPFAKKKGGHPTHVIAIGDAHDDPSLPKDRFRWIGRHVAERSPDMVLSIGDMLTMDSLNSHTRPETFEGRYKPIFSEDIASGHEALNEFAIGAEGWDGPKHITLGNHEHRVELYANNHPEVYGVMQQELHGMLDTWGWTYSPYGEVFYIDGVGFVHVPLNDMGKPYGGKTAEQRVANDAVTDLVFGHSHRARFHSASKVGGARVQVMNLGSAMPDGYVADYAKHTSHGWTYGIFDLQVQNGKIVEHEFYNMKTLENAYG